MALALNASGRRNEAMPPPASAWTSGTLDDSETSLVLSFFPGALTTADHDTRMDRLLWLGKAAASRQLAYTSPQARGFRRAPRDAECFSDAQIGGRRANRASRNDAGYIADRRSGSRRRPRRSARLLAAPRSLAKAPTDPEEWLESC